MFEPIVKRTNRRPAQPLTAEVVRRLKEECDDYSSFMEGGQFYVMGFKGRDTVLLAFGDRDQFERMMNPSDKDLENGYGYRR